MIKPYYSEPNIQIYNGDCLEVMKEFDNESIDMVLTSPPYGQLRDYDGFSFSYNKTGLELFRILKSGGIIVWVTGDQIFNGSESGDSFRQALYFMSIGFNLHDTMIYEKNGASYPEKSRYYQIFEYMFIFSKGIPKTINLLKDRKNKWTKSWGNRSVRDKSGKLIKKGKIINGKEFGVRFNIWRYKTGAGYSTKDKYVFEHPAIFPEQLAKDHINSWSNPGDTIIDPFLGSGTTARACKDLGRKCIGIEISKKYCDIAIQRLGQEVLNLNE